MRHAHNFDDLTGRKFCRVTVLEFAGNMDNGMSLWKCRCDCGTQFIAVGANLKGGATRSCGCLRRDTMIGNKRNAVKR